MKFFGNAGIVGRTFCSTALIVLNLSNLSSFTFCNGFMAPFPSSSIQSTKKTLFKRMTKIPTRPRETGTRTGLWLAATRGEKFKEQLMEQVPDAAIVKAVESKFPNGQDVIASDVAAVAGVSLSKAKEELTLLASMSRGDISVSPDGELLYQFPDNLSTVLSTNSAKYKTMQTFKKAWPRIFWLVRVSFGVALLSSIALIFATIFFIQTSSSSSDDDRRSDNRSNGGGGMSFGYNAWFGPSPFDFFYYRPYYGYYATNDGRDPEEMGFLESIFSYIFGDGNPNIDIDQTQLQLAANMIRKNKGAVTAEQLAPFVKDDLPSPKSAASGNFVDESFVLPIVSQLNGQPQVTEDGDIIYVFPDLQLTTTKSSSSAALTTASTQQQKKLAEITLKKAGLSKSASAREIQFLLQSNGISTRGAIEKQDLIELLQENLPPLTQRELQELQSDDDTMLLEKQASFSLASNLNKVLAGGLGILNIAGVLYLGNLFSQLYATYGTSITLPGIYGVAQTLYPALFLYAVLFNAIPAIRYFALQRSNAQIQQRNSVRQQWKQILESKTSKDLQRKLKAAKNYSTSEKFLSSQDNIYNTKQDITDTKKNKNDDDLSDFDKRLME